MSESSEAMIGRLLWSDSAAQRAWSRERRRTDGVLRLHQESLARLGRPGSVGGLAAAMAHAPARPGPASLLQR
jgi:hypothetical protein